MIEQSSPTIEIKIYLSGDISIIKKVCRNYCLHGLCVSVKEVLYVYAGGEEYGVEIGLLNYPRFPSDSEHLLEKAKELAFACRNAACQWSYLIVTPENTIWNSTRTI